MPTPLSTISGRFVSFCHIPQGPNSNSARPSRAALFLKQLRQQKCSGSGPGYTRSALDLSLTKAFGRTREPRCRAGWRIARLRCSLQHQCARATHPATCVLEVFAILARVCEDAANSTGRVCRNFKLTGRVQMVHYRWWVLGAPRAGVRVIASACRGVPQQTPSRYRRGQA